MNGALSKPAPDTAWFRNWLRPVRILLAAANDTHGRVARHLRADRGGVHFELTHVQRLGEGIECLKDKPIDAVLLDLGLPDSHGLEGVARMHEIVPETAIVVLTSLSDERVGLRAVQKGAQDYLIKDELNGHLLLRSMRYAIERRRLQCELEQARAQIRMLSGLLPVCAGCHRVRDDKRYWNEVESYLARHSGAEFCHCVCRACEEALYPEIPAVANSRTR